MQIPAHYQAYLRGRILPQEGGYTPAKIDAKGRLVDPESLFGMTKSEMARVILTLDAQDRAQMPSYIARRITEIQQTPAKERSDEVSQFMQEIGRLLDPSGKATMQPSAGIPLRSNHLPASNVTAEGLARIRAVQNIALATYYKDYIVNPGFDRYPEQIRDNVIGFAINGGEARARWITVKAMVEAGILTNDEYATFPSVKSAEANDRIIFTRGHTGYPYTLQSMNDKILNHLQHATPAQLMAMEQRYTVWQRTYYLQLANEDPRFKQFLPGLLNRASESGFTTVSYEKPQVTAAIVAAPVAPPLSSASLSPIPVQLRSNPFGEAIALGTPFGLVMYDIDPATHQVTKLWQKPDEVTVHGTIGGALPPTISWRGNDAPLTLSPELNRTIEKLAWGTFLGKSNAHVIKRAFELTRDGQHLAGINDLIFTGPKLAVRDMPSNQEVEVPRKVIQTASSIITTGR